MNSQSIDPSSHSETPECEHSCPRDCALLNRMLLRETALGGVYNQLLKQCDYPDVRRFILDLVKEHDQLERKLERKLNKMYSTFDPSGV